MKLLFTILLPILATAQLAHAQEPIRERIEWADIWVTDADKDDLPRVLLIGDSITRGYFGEVEKQLAGKAYCARLTTSKCVSDPYFPDEVQLLLKQYKFAVIHFNNGLHGWGYTEDQSHFGHIRIAEVVYEGPFDSKFVEDVRDGQYVDGEGVVAKGIRLGKNKNAQHGLWMSKVKTKGWLEELKRRAEESEQFQQALKENLDEQGIF